MEESVMVSIVVPIYNVKEYLPRCIESVLCQSYKKYEIILVDDGSTDGSSEICDMYASKHACIHVVHKKNGGLSSARNVGLNYGTKGKYIMFLDSDDFWKEDNLGNIVGCMDEKRTKISCDIYFM